MIFLKNMILPHRETEFLCFVFLIPLPYKLCPTFLKDLRDHGFAILGGCGDEKGGETKAKI